MATGTTQELAEAWPTVTEMLEDIENMAGQSCSPPEELLSRYVTGGVASSTTSAKSSQDKAQLPVGNSQEGIRTPEAACEMAKQFIANRSAMTIDIRRLAELAKQLDAFSGELGDMVRANLDSTAAGDT